MLCLGFGIEVGSTPAVTRHASRPLQAKAAIDSHDTSASMCDLRNMGNILAQKGLIRQNGAIVNILSSNNIPVFCPIIINAYDTSGYNVFIRALNPTASSRQFKCVLSQYDVDNFTKRSIQRTLTLQAGFAGGLTFYNLGVIPLGDRLDLRCEVPPGGAYGGISSF
jgi:hypothetical protein